MKKNVIAVVCSGMLAVGLCQNHSAEAEMFFQQEAEQTEANASTESQEDGHALYIDGQLQTYTGPPLFHNGSLYVTVQAAVQALNEYIETEESAAVSASASSYDWLREQNHIDTIHNRDVVPIEVLQQQGIKAEWLDDPGRLHLETVDLLRAGDIKIGDSMQEVNRHYDVEWTKGYGQAADYIGFYGENVTFEYTDRFGKERSGDVPEMQVEVIDNTLTYIILSSPDYETEKGIQVGDSLFDAARAYGSEHIKETILGKIVHIYHVNNGSVWFIADDDRDIERIALWGFQLPGYER
ncbi:hypothetical protein SAMN05192534_11849 [Alteribacillus persepolensis]|uniref:Uncharacterized protein n=1 Tax=Alteribacillus persepolensis TaxID=568899 RepID=A0A1G8H4A8_9BACI|nr:hypothetical protein [Alteribacillus persepolensis]SDI01474.1 hypothetical protein SAMN05192534_11849 [Alteribacillus persepolensis]